MSGGTVTRLLGALHEALGRGDFARLGTIQPELEAAEHQLAGLSEGELRAIRRAAETAERRLKAALQGIRSARRRLAEIDAAERGMTYDAAGTRRGVAPAGPGRRI